MTENMDVLKKSSEKNFFLKLVQNIKIQILM